MCRMWVDIEPSTHAEGVRLGLDDAVAPLPSGVAWVMCEEVYNPQNEACGTSQTKRTPTHPAEKKRSVTFSGNIPRAFGNHPNALLASVK